MGHRDFKVHILSYDTLAEQLGLPSCIAEDKVEHSLQTNALLVLSLSIDALSGGALV